MMLTILLKSNDPMPLYQQLYSGIRCEIEKGGLCPDEKLPSKRTLAAHLQVSLATVQAAYDQLLAEGYIRSVPRKGYYTEHCAVLTHEEPPSEHVPHVQPQACRNPERVRFATNGVDTQQFPFTIWAKLSRQILSGQQEALMQPIPPDGLYELRAAIAQNLYAFRSLHVEPEQILVGAGSEYLLGLLVQLLGRDRCCAVEDPGYRKTQSILESNGMKTVPVPMDEDGLSAQALVSSGADIVHVTPSHHFPLGIVMPVSRRIALLQWAAEQPHRYIIEDEYDSEIRFTGMPIPTLRSLDQSDRVIYMNTFAKTLTPSLRISYLVLPRTLRVQFQENLSFYANTVPSFEQYTLARFLREGYFERHLNRMKKTYRKRRDRLMTVIRSHPLAPYLEIVGADAGLHFLLHVHLPVPEQTLIALAEKAGVDITGLSAYYAEKDAGFFPHPVLILGYACLSEETAAGAMQHVLDVWQQYLRTKGFFSV